MGRTDGKVGLAREKIGSGSEDGIRSLRESMAVEETKVLASI